MNVATDVPAEALARLRALAQKLAQDPGFDEVAAALKAGRAATLDGVRGSSCALAATALVEHAAGPLLIVVPHPADIDEFCDELTLFTERRAEKFPAWETIPSEVVVRDDIYGDRMRMLKTLVHSSGGRGSEFGKQAF